MAQSVAGPAITDFSGMRPVRSAGKAGASGVTVTLAAIQAGKLVVEGTTAVPKTAVRLDDRFRVTSAKITGQFRFDLVYLPSTCIVELKTSSGADQVVVAGCGLQGPPGETGPAGPPGPTGAQGETGERGQRGAKGVAGAEGPAGPAGEPGPQGPVGPAGGIGPQGPAGPRGVKGAQGVQGPQGIAGMAGPPGPSGIVQAQQVRVVAGIVLTSVYQDICSLTITTSGGKVLVNASVGVSHMGVGSDGGSTIYSTLFATSPAVGRLNLAAESGGNLYMTSLPGGSVQTHAMSWIDAPAAETVTYSLSARAQAGANAVALTFSGVPCMIQAVELAPQVSVMLGQ